VDEEYLEELESSGRGKSRTRAGRKTSLVRPSTAKAAAAAAAAAAGAAAPASAAAADNGVGSAAAVPAKAR
jgi:hypothetical protein